MKNDTSKKVRLGIFITFGIAVFILGVYFIGERQQLFRSAFHLTGIFNDVGGLQAGNNVRFSGVNVGTVEKISIVSDKSVKVELLIDESSRKFIRKDAIASIGSEGLIGNKILIITPGAGDASEIENNDSVATVQPIDMDEVLLSLKTTIDNTSRISNDLSRITSTLQSGKGTIGKLLMDKSYAENIDTAFANMKEGSAGFKILMDKAKKSWLLWGF